MQLRDYQEAAVLNFAKGCVEFDRQLIILPTGAGKTIVFAALAKRFWEKRRERTLVLVHREALMQQAADKIHRMTGLVPTIEMGASRASRHSEVVVGSVQTLQSKRLASWPVDHFGLLVADEAHHALARSWQTTLKHFKAKVLGVTATPGRSDKKNLGEYFQNIAHEVGLVSMIKEGYLVPIKIQTIPLQIDLSAVKQSSGDFDANGVSDVLTPILREVVRQMNQAIGTRKTIVFLPLIKTSKLFCELCQEAGIRAAHADGEMDASGVLKEFSEGKHQVLCNAMLLTEGYDETSIECVVNLRPTKSTELYSQIVGRGTRLHPGKGDLLVLDFLWLHEKHSLARPASLIATDEEIAEEMTKRSAKVDIVDLIGLEKEAINEREIKMLRELAAKQKRKAKLVSLDEVLACVPKIDRVYGTSPMDENLPPMPWQVEFLERAKIDPETCTTRAQADFAIAAVTHRRQNGLCTLPQMIYLQRLGHPCPDTASFAEASTFLSQRFNR